MIIDEIVRNEMVKLVIRFNPSRPVLTLAFPSENCIEIKIKLNFHTSLWFLKRSYEGLSGLRLGLEQDGLKGLKK